MKQGKDKKKSDKDQGEGFLKKVYRNRRGGDFSLLIVLSLGLFIAISLSIGSPQG